MDFTLDAIVAATGGQLLDPTEGATRVSGATIDSRTAEAGSLFVPIVAERDGHDFVDAAVARGVGAYLTSAADGVPAAPAIAVEDTSIALQALGRAARARLDGHVVGVTGSVGKTSVKDLIAAACAGSLVTHANPASFNNELGLPLTLINAPVDAAVTVIEMGARGFGHIADLCAIGRPTIGVVTRVASAHTELLGDLEGVARAKGELVEALPASGTAVLNADDPRVLAMANRTTASIVTFGAHQPGLDAHVGVSDLQLDDGARARFTVRTPSGASLVRLAVAGAHMAGNAAAAIAVALAVGIDLQAAVAGVEGAALSANRMAVQTMPSGAIVINDSYNANPTSMRAGIDALVALRADRRWAIVGVMAELGDDGDDEHAAIAREACDRGITVIAIDAPSYGKNATHVNDIDDALAQLRGVGSGDAVLVKGSRVAALERVAERLSASA